MPDEMRTPTNPAETPPAGWKVEGLPKGKNGQGKNGRPAPPKRSLFSAPFVLVAVALLAANWFWFSRQLAAPERMRVSYSEFVIQVEAGNVREITSTGDTIQGEFKKEVTYPPPELLKAGEKQSTNVLFATERPGYEDATLGELLRKQGVNANAKSLDTTPSFWESLIFGFGPVLLILGLFLYFARRAGGAMTNPLNAIGRSKAQRFDPNNAKRVTFKDVAGIDDAEEELVEIVDFLKNPDKYRKLGASIPKGVLLSGPPGTGKTLLAKAVAGEANVPFFSMSASEFVEMIVGVGASRVRDLFREARDAAPCIIFIDEVDAIGRQRGSANSIGGHSEAEQTLNQILTEMDGFTGSEGVIVLAATNRPEILDAALLRPGRFDRRVVVTPPDQVGRRAILVVHSKSVAMGPDTDLDAIASATPGMVGADLRNLINEGALLAARRGHEQVTQNDLMDSLEKIILGTERHILVSPHEKERTAYHESGHALLGMLTPGADPVRKISIIPRGGALGVTFQAPDSDRYSYTESFLKGRIVGALGGRAAEELVYGDVTTGAESDLEMVTRIARRMVGRWGFSDAIGPLAVLPGEQQSVFLASPDSPSQATQELVDREARRIVETCYREALATLRAHRTQLEALTRALLGKETLDEADAYVAAGVDRMINRSETQAMSQAVFLPPAPAALGAEVQLVPPSGTPGHS